MGHYISRDYSQVVDAIQYINSESVEDIKNMLGTNSPYIIRKSSKGIFVGEYKVEQGQYVIQTQVAVVVKDQSVFHARFKRVEIQSDLFEA